MIDSLAIFALPEAWAALATLIVLEVVLGIDNLIFISILSNKLPLAQRQRVRRLGISLALIMRLVLLSAIAWLVGLTAPVFDLGIQGMPGPHGEPSFETSFSWRDLILIAGGLFLLWKATKEIHHNVDPSPNDDVFDTSKATLGVGAAIIQILLLDLVFSVDSILTAVGMTEHLPIMIVAVLVAVGVMLLAADPLANFIGKNPTVVMLALGFLLMIGVVLIADGFGVHVPKGYIYAAMAFAAESRRSTCSHARRGRDATPRRRPAPPSESIERKGASAYAGAMSVHFHEEDLPEGVLGPGAVAVDTETMGLQLSRDRLCLVQISDGRGDEHLVRFGAESDYAAPNLKAVLADPERLKLYHFARFDLASIRAYLGVLATPVYCTKTASRLVRTYTDRHGLKDLVKEMLGQEISKQQQQTDWGAPDLSDAQKDYAAADVRYLHALKEKLDARLKREGRLELAQACFDFLPHRAILDLAGWAEQDIFAHV